MTRHKWLLATLIVIAVIVAAIIYSVLDPSSDNNFFPKCVFLQLTGWKCPGCGTQRAIHALLTGDFVGAWCYNAMLILAIPYVALLFAGILLKKSHPRLQQAIESVPAITLVIVIIVLWWILRNIFGW